MKPYTEIADARLVKALAHPLRVQILDVLERQDASPKEISVELGIPVATVSYHMRQLKSLGLVRIVKRTQRRGAIEHHYRADKKVHISDATWDQIPELVKQALATAALEQTVRHIKMGAELGGFERAEAHLSRTHVTLDAQGWSDLAEAYQRLLADIDRIDSESAKRLQNADHEGGSAGTAVLMLFGGAGPGAVDGGDPAGAPAAKSKRSAAAH